MQDIMKREGSHVKSGKMYTDSFAGDPPFLPDVSGQDVNESCNGRPKRGPNKRIIYRALGRLKVEGA